MVQEAIAIDPSYISKSGKKIPWLGYFWSGCAGEYKRGLEIMGNRVIDVDNHECMTLGSVQSPDTKTLNNIDKTLVDWYAGYLINRKRTNSTCIQHCCCRRFLFQKAHSSHLCVINGLMLSVVSGMMRFFFIRQRQTYWKERTAKSYTMVQ